MPTVAPRKPLHVVCCVRWSHAHLPRFSAATRRDIMLGEPFSSYELSADAPFRWAMERLVLAMRAFASIPTKPSVRCMGFVGALSRDTSVFEPARAQMGLLVLHSTSRAVFQALTRIIFAGRHPFEVITLTTVPGGATKARSVARLPLEPHANSWMALAENVLATEPVLCAKTVIAEKW